MNIIIPIKVSFYERLLNKNLCIQYMANIFHLDSYAACIIYVFDY